MSLKNKLSNLLLAIPNWFVWFGIILVMITSAIILINNKIDQLLEQEHKEITLQEAFIQTHLNASKHIVDAFSNTIRQRYLAELDSPSGTKQLSYLKDYPEYQSYGLSGFKEEGGNAALSGTLTGYGNIKSIDKTLRSEIIAALSIDSQIGTHTEKNSDFIWAYYTSKRNFVFLAPKVPVTQFQFSSVLYTKDYWTQAAPTNNPKHKTILTDLYDDAGGQGLMITASSPVIANGEFLGIASIDIGIDTLNQFLETDHLLGEFILVGKKGNIVAKQGLNSINEKLDFDFMAMLNKPTKKDQSWWFFIPIENTDLFIAAQISAFDLYKHAISQISALWLLFLVMCFLLFTLLKLKRALIKVTELAHIDPLSSLENRRGFLNSVSTLFSLNKRKCNSAWSILMIDIDHFKKVNDEYGHAEGDKIIIKLAGLLKQNVRSSDLICRWGGEEFVIFLFDTPLDTAMNIAEKYRKTVFENIKSPDKKPISISIGVAESKQEEIEEVLERADRHLYFAKHAGRNKVSCKTI